MVNAFTASTVMKSFTKTFCYMERTHEPDGVGGFVTKWTEGEQFEAVERHDTTVEAQVAEQSSTASTYTLLINSDVPLAFPDYVKRIEDGQIFQATSDAADSRTPAESSMNLRAVQCKKAVLP
jgi:hypothetical protein